MVCRNWGSNFSMLWPLN
ncbi:hypothetical protein B8A23_08540 [Staphylococcus aureus]|nr:hypothetical protein B8A23_08540 [Staphylococcus aureus]